MEKKIIFFELPINIIQKIDKNITTGSRSDFVSELLEKQLQTNIGEMDTSAELPTSMQSGELIEKPGELRLVNNKGMTLGTFDINSPEGFENLAKKIGEISNDPEVRMKTRRWR